MCYRVFPSSKVKHHVKIAQQDGVLLQGKVHLANQVKLQLPGDEVSDQTVAMTVIEAMPHYDQLLWSMQEMMPSVQQWSGLLKHMHMSWTCDVTAFRYFRELVTRFFHWTFL